MSTVANNVFNGGMITDFNPLTTPNNVLTNALNATLITYNGNEYMLQNDMGNGRVESAYLPAGYVPVGIKEFGGVIYVASYNPLTNKGQIGSFPSPERNITSAERSKQPITFDMKDFITKGKVIRLKIFGEETVMHAGDKFTILMDYTKDGAAVLKEDQPKEIKRFLSNYQNIITINNKWKDYISDGGILNNKVQCLKNKAVTFKLCVIDKNNNLYDITDTLQRVEQSYEGDGIADVIPLAPGILKYNTEFYTQVGDANKMSTTVDDYRKMKAVNNFNSKMTGNVCLVAEYNTVDNVGFVIDGELTEDKQNTILYIEADWKYNCPDGLFSGDESAKGINYEKSNQQIYGTKDLFEGYENTIKGYKIVIWNIGNDEPSGDSDAMLIPFITTDDELQFNSSKLGDPVNGNVSGCTTYINEINPYYETKQLNKLSLQAYNDFIKDKGQSIYTTRGEDHDNIINYKIIPVSELLGELPGLETRGSINLNKLGSGEIKINYWKYYKNDSNIQLTWGFEAYPKKNEVFKNITFTFKDVYSDSPLEYTYTVGNKRSINGKFNEILHLPDIIDNEDTGERYGALYQVTISMQSSIDKRTKFLIDYDGEVKTTLSRYLFNTKLYNNAYLDTVLSSCKERVLGKTPTFEGITIKGSADDWGSDVAEYGKTANLVDGKFIIDQENGQYPSTTEPSGAGLQLYRKIYLAVQGDLIYEQNSIGGTDDQHSDESASVKWDIKTSQYSVTFNDNNIQYQATNIKNLPFIPQLQNLTIQNSIRMSSINVADYNKQGKSTNTTNEFWVVDSEKNDFGTFIGYNEVGTFNDSKKIIIYGKARQAYTLSKQTKVIDRCLVSILYGKQSYLGNSTSERTSIPMPQKVMIYEASATGRAGSDYHRAMVSIKRLDEDELFTPSTEHGGTGQSENIRSKVNDGDGPVEYTFSKNDLTPKLMDFVNDNYGSNIIFSGTNGIESNNGEDGVHYSSRISQRKYRTAVFSYTLLNQIHVDLHWKAIDGQYVLFNTFIICPLTFGNFFRNMLNDFIQWLSNFMVLWDSQFNVEDDFPDANNYIYNDDYTVIMSLIYIKTITNNNITQDVIPKQYNNTEKISFNSEVQNSEMAVSINYSVNGYRSEFDSNSSVTIPYGICDPTTQKVSVLNIGLIPASNVLYYLSGKNVRLVGPSPFIVQDNQILVSKYYDSRYTSDESYDIPTWGNSPDSFTNYAFDYASLFKFPNQYPQGIATTNSAKFVEYQK